jgi:hypothetical protein
MNVPMMPLMVVGLVVPSWLAARRGRWVFLIAAGLLWSVGWLLMPAGGMARLEGEDQGALWAVLGWPACLAYCGIVRQLRCFGTAFARRRAAVRQGER